MRTRTRSKPGSRSVGARRKQAKPCLSFRHKKAPRPFGNGVFLFVSNSGFWRTLATSHCAWLDRDQTFADSFFPGQFTGTTDRFSLLASSLFRRLLIMVPTLHFTEGSLPLHFLFQRAEGLLHIIIADNDLYDDTLSIFCLDVSITHVASSPEARAIAPLRRRVHTALSDSSGDVAVGVR